MQFLKVTQVNRGKSIKTWVNKDKIIYIENYEGDSKDQSNAIMLLEDLGSPLFLAETTDELLRKIELG